MSDTGTAAVERDRTPDLHGLGIRRLTLIGGGIIAAFFLVGGGWAALVPIQSAAIAPGSIVVESSRKTVQHLEGGIVEAILVDEGDRVEAGQVLLILDDTRSGAEVDLLRGRLAAALAAYARLVAERDGADEIDFGPGIAALIADAAEREALIEGERTIFRERRNLLRSQDDLNRQRIAQLEQEIVGLREEIAAADRQLELIAEEEQAVADLVDKGYARKPRLLELRRGQAGIGGERGSNVAAIARARQRIRESELNVVDVRTRFLNEVVTSLRDTRAEIADLRDRLGAAEDVTHRTEVVAPVTGIVVDKQVFTTGGVIRPGQPLLDIVPTGDRLAVSAQVAPADIDVVHAGLAARVRIAAFNMADSPILDGKVRTVSADALTDERTGLSYYTAQIDVPDTSKLPPGAELYPGMPAEVMIVTGERTMLGYLMEPILISLRRAMREP